ncbi:MAG TPA: septum formation initiator family protein [Dehalococcoidia bacterium]|nr:septum formation initiator family protein [Dehalococcoidia bacterium]
MLRRLILLFSPGRIILALSLVVIAYLLVHAGGRAVDYYRLTDDEDRLRREVQELMAQEKQLEQIREYLRSDEYVEFMARRVFGLVKPGETLVIVKAPPPAEATPDEPGRRWWQDLFGR